MSLIEIQSEIPGDLRETEAAIEWMLAAELHQERARLFHAKADISTIVLDRFEEWSAEYGLPTSPHVMAAYLLELHRFGAPFDELENIAAAYLFENAWNVHVPVVAALRYCAAARRGPRLRPVGPGLVDQGARSGHAALHASSLGRGGGITDITDITTPSPGTEQPDPGGPQPGQLVLVDGRWTAWGKRARPGVEDGDAATEERVRHPLE